MNWTEVLLAVSAGANLGLFLAWLCTWAECSEKHKSCDRLDGYLSQERNQHRNEIAEAEERYNSLVERLRIEITRQH